MRATLESPFSRMRMFLTSAFVNLPVIDEWLSPIMFVVAAQLCTLHAAELAGVNPEGLNKATRTT